jgi:serine/threonine protein kinase
MPTSNHRVSVWAAGTHSIPPDVKVRDLPDLPSLPDSVPDLPEKPGKVEVADAGAKLLKRSGDEAPRTQQKRPRGIGLQPFALKPVGFLQLEDPWHSRLEKLDKLAVMDQAGSVVVAASRTKQKTKLVPVRELNGYSKSDLEHLRRAMDQHIVELIAVFFHQDVISLLYEVMDLSVSDIVLTPKGILPLQERATICHAVLCGLRHIHALEAVHGDITTRTILLNRVGRVKIGKSACY